MHCQHYNSFLIIPLISTESFFILPFLKPQLISISLPPSSMSNLISTEFFFLFQLIKP